MAGADFVKALDQHVAWGISVLDLQDGIFGKSVSDLTESEAKRAAALIAERGLSVYCLSTSLFRQDVECGGDEFRRCHLQPLVHTLELAQILKPRLVRLLAASTAKRADFKDSIAYVQMNYPWVIRIYREAVERIDRAGFRATIRTTSGTVCSRRRRRSWSSSGFSAIRNVFASVGMCGTSGNAAHSPAWRSMRC
jgi:hypothetical protein